MKKLMLAAALVALAACGGKNDAKPAADPAADLDAIADDYLAAIVAYSPFSVMFGGIGDDVKEDHAAMEENSPAALARLHTIEDELAERLEKLDGASFASRADLVLYETLVEALAAERGLRICRRELWSVNHMFGWESSFSSVASAQPVSTPVERAMALARWRQLPAYIAQDRKNLEAGLAAGYSAPKRVVARVITQLDAMIAAGPSASPFLTFAAGVKDDPAFSAAISALAKDEIEPAVIAYRDFLRDEYAPKAREALSITANPDGAACYEAMLRSYHTAEIGAKATFERGQAAVAANREAVIERGGAMFGLDDFTAILARVGEDRSNRFESEQQLIDYTRAQEPVAREKVAPFFSHLPEQALVVEPFPAYLKGAGLSSRYEQKPAADGPATYRIDTDDWATQTRGEAEITLVHEGWPGHHLQIATAAKVAQLHPVARLLGSTAYIEGWARYAEGLAEEAGLYESGYGAITRRAWPARGMVVDPGLHLYGWTNDQAKAFLMESGRFDDAAADVMLDRIAVIPGQLTAYDTGGLEIAALRSEAMRRLGARFDIQDFHDRVLEDGAVPLGALRKHVEEWIAAEEKAGG